MKSKVLLAAVCALGIAGTASAKEKIYVNDEVTTHIVMPENIKMVDISTTKLIGNQCADNIVRIKPFIDNDSIQTFYRENELMATLTLIGERHSFYPSCALRPHAVIRQSGGLNAGG